MKKVTMLGGAGFIGSNLATRLLYENIEKLLIIDDLSTGAESNLKNILLDQKVDFINSKIEINLLSLKKTIQLSVNSFVCCKAPICAENLKPYFLFEFL